MGLLRIGEYVALFKGDNIQVWKQGKVPELVEDNSIIKLNDDLISATAMLSGVAEDKKIYTIVVQDTKFNVVADSVEDLVELLKDVGIKIISVSLEYDEPKPKVRRNRRGRPKRTIVMHLNKIVEDKPPTLPFDDDYELDDEPESPPTEMADN